jgi:predicted 2-oxoglutarate/Fe(II)-dependent dioxygenase YbiX
MKKLLEVVKLELGISTKIACSLYKLLLYEPGGHFSKHTDTEKEDNMFGTLTINLPSKYEGGSLIVRHASREKVFDFHKDSPFNFYYTAFYADCEHEVQKVTSGYRLNLVYNLVHQSSEDPPETVDSGEHVDKVVQLLKKWSQDTGYHFFGAALNTYSCSRKVFQSLEPQVFKSQLIFEVVEGKGLGYWWSTKASEQEDLL